MARSRFAYRKSGNGSLWVGRLMKQIIVVIMILLIVIVIKKLNISVMNQAVETLHYQMTQDYGPADIEEAAKSVFAYTKEVPKLVGEAIQKSENQMEFVPPASETAAVSTFGAKSDGSGGEQSSSQNCIKFASAQELQVYAVAGGTVTEIFDGKDGNTTLHVSHGNEKSSVYGGCSRVYVKPLERVKKGQLIASIMPESGSALNFELWIDKKAVNPAEYIDF